MNSLMIGKLARLAGVGVTTIRFYERQGLIAEPPRRESGYRQYPRETVDRVRFIRRAKELGFSLKEIDELLSLRIAPGTTCKAIRERTLGKIADIDARAQMLQRMKETLVRLAEACGGRGSVSECPILEALEETEEEVLR